jgi:L-lactate dehydrogenase complex protein LldF
LWRWSMQHRWALDILPGRLKDFSLGYLLDQSGWRKRRESLKVADKSFRELWKASH